MCCQGHCQMLIVLRKKAGVKARGAVTSKRQRQVHKVLQDPNNYNKPALKEVVFPPVHNVTHCFKNGTTFIYFSFLTHIRNVMLKIRISRSSLMVSTLLRREQYLKSRW